MNCPKCDEEMEYQEGDPDTGVEGDWYCETCDVSVARWEVDDEPDPRD